MLNLQGGGEGGISGGIEKGDEWRALCKTSTKFVLFIDGESLEQGRQQIALRYPASSHMHHMPVETNGVAIRRTFDGKVNTKS